MNPFFYLKIFSWIVATGLGCMIFTDNWQLMLMVGLVMLFYVAVTTAPRR